MPRKSNLFSFNRIYRTTNTSHRVSIAHLLIVIFYVYVCDRGDKIYSLSISLLWYSIVLVEIPVKSLCLQRLLNKTQ